MKKFLSLTLALALAAGTLAGCGGGNDGNGGDKGGDQGGSASAIKIGGHGPLTGGAAIYGNAAKNGAQIAVDEINAKGGIQFELKYEDDQHDAEKAVDAYNALKDWGMQISLSSVTSKPGAATSPNHNDDRIFGLTPSASAVEVTQGADNVFQMCFADPNQGTASAKYIAEQALGTKIAVIYKNDDPYSAGIYETFKSEAAAEGLEIVSATTFTEDSQNDFSVQIGKAKSEGADLVFLPMYYAPASLILKQAKDSGYTPKFFGVDGMDGILTLDGFDKSLAEGVMLLTPFNADADDERTKSFVDTYQKQFGEIPNQFAADAYDCIYAIHQAIENDGSIDSSTDAADLCDKLIAQFTSMTFSGLTGEDMVWEANGQVSKGPKGMVIQNGSYVGMN